MKLRPRNIDIEAFEWKDSSSLPNLVIRPDLSGEKYSVLSYESILSCCGKSLGEHGFLLTVSLYDQGIVCPGMWVVIEKDHTGEVELRKPMWMSDILKEYEQI